VDCVVFDIDDTLYLERDYVRSGFVAVGERILQRYSIADFSDCAWALFESGVRGDIFDQALERVGVTKTSELISDLVATYRQHEPAISLLPDAERALNHFGKAHKLAVITDGPVASQSAKARALGVRQWTDDVILTGEFGPGFGKPHPRAFQLVEERTGASGPGCVYIADNPSKDFAGPRSLNWKTVRIRRPGGLHELAPSGPDVDHEITELSQLSGALE